MGALLDQIVTFTIVAAAAAFVLWRFMLPARLRLVIRHRLSGGREPCAPQPEGGGCTVGCAGCSLAAPRGTGTALDSTQRTG